MNIDTSQVAGLLPDKRWFGHKDRTVEGLNIIDQAIAEESDPQLVLAIAAVNLGDLTVTYHLPLLLGGVGEARDAFEDPQRLAILGELMAHGRTLRGQSGTFTFGGPGLDPSSPPGSQSVRNIDAEQSNSSVVFDDKVILKLYRRVEAGPNPDLELTRFLTAEGFPNVATHVGEIEYTSDELGVYDLGLAQVFLPDAKEGWNEIVAAVRSLYHQADGADALEDISFLVAERSAAGLASIAELGEVTAEMHIVLSREGLDTDFAPEPVEHEDLKSWIAETEAALSALEGDGLPELTPLIPELGRVAARAGAVSEPGLKIRVHGDYHLGQVLMTSRGWVITDFEGEPARSLKARRAKSSPLRDVAGMLRSFGYAAAAALFDASEPGSPERERLEPWAREWESAARTRFLDAYLSKSHEGRFLPQDREDALALIDLLELGKALYEIDYERSHRPDWLRIPLHGLSRLAERADG